MDYWKLTNKHTNMDDRADDWGGSSWDNDRYDRGDRFDRGGSRKPGDWDCPSCKFMNYASRNQCWKCRTPKDGDDGYGDRGGYRGGRDRMGGNDRDMRPGDWLCSDCKYHNFASRSTCNRCQMAREGGGGGGFGGGGFGGGGGNRRPGDWDCPISSCKFLNFASRSTCMKCNQMKE